MQGVVIVAVVPACLPVTLSKTERAYAAAAVSLQPLLPWLSFMRLQQATKRRLHLQEPAARRQCVTMAVLLFRRRRTVHMWRLRGRRDRPARFNIAALLGFPVVDTMDTGRCRW